MILNICDQKNTNLRQILDLLRKKIYINLNLALFNCIELRFPCGTGIEAVSISIRELIVLGQRKVKCRKLIA